VRVVDERESRGIDRGHVIFELGDGFPNVVERSMGILLLEFPTEHFTKHDFKTGYIEHSVVKPLGESRKILVDEFTVLGDGIAANDDRVLLLEVGEGDFRKPFVELGFGDAARDAIEQAALGMIVLAPIIHVLEDVGFLDDGGFPFENRFERFVRDDYARFEDPIRIRVQASHFKVYPAKSSFRHTQKKVSDRLRSKRVPVGGLPSENGKVSQLKWTGLIGLSLELGSGSFSVSLASFLLCAVCRLVRERGR